ncbi:MAG: hypothetical protein WBV69_02655, partial [Candidatus Sulfotelmatobacter sp.]
MIAAELTFMAGEQLLCWAKKGRKTTEMQEKSPGNRKVVLNRGAEVEKNEAQEQFKNAISPVSTTQP